MGSGDSGSRTRVQTRNPYAFYMLIPVWIFVRQRWPGLPAAALSALFSPTHRSLRGLVLILLRPFILSASRRGLGETSRRGTLYPDKVTYCASVRLRELLRSCQLDLNEPFLTDGIRVRHAYVPVLPAVKTGISPRCTQSVQNQPQKYCLSARGARKSAIFFVFP